MGLHLPMPRLLPLTILAMTGSLLLHGVHVVAGWLGPTPDDLALVAPARAEEAVKPAAAQTTHGPAAAHAPTPADAAAAAPTPPPAAIPAPVPAGPPPVSESERALLQDLRARRGALEGQAAGIAERETILAAAAQRLDARVNELTALQHRLEQLDGARKEREEANWQGMVKVYETMKPRDAATIFNDLDMPVLLQVMDRMKASKAAVVLGAMQPERARQVTTQLAELRLKRETVPGG